MSSTLIRSLSVVVVLGSMVVLGGCSGGSGDAAASIAVTSTEDLGKVLVDGDGSVLYVFEPDAAKTVSCIATCASKWPPLRAEEGGAPDAAAGVDASLIGTAPSPTGGSVITYDGWPLYRYAADREPGEHRGQDVYLNGGDWYVMRPDGKPLIP